MAALDALVAKVRKLINDPAGASQEYAAADLEKILQRHSRQARYLELTPEETRLPGGVVEYHDFYSTGIGDWDEAATIYDTDYNVVTPTTADYAIGYWSFTTPQGQTLYVSGYVYDVYGAACEALDGMLAKLRLQFGFSQAEQKVTPEQKFAMTKRLQDDYARQRWPTTIQQVRSDTDGRSVPNRWRP